jgi:RND superfamily putative drug exporter
MLVLSLVAFLAVAVVGGPAPGRFEAPRAFDDPGSPATAARQQIERATGKGASAEVVALVKAPAGSPAVARVARELRAHPGVASVAQAPANGDSPLRSRDGHQTLLPATLRADAATADVAKRLRDRFDGDKAVALGGTAVAASEVSDQATRDLATAELLAFPVLALLSLLVFRGVAAALPLAVGGVSVLGAFAVLRGVNEALALSPFALNLVIGLGLGVAVDYSLFCVSRFREELGRGADVPAAVQTTMATAGRTVVFSAVTVAAAMACLTVFPQRFLVSMGIGGAVVALVAAAATLLTLPALLVLLGPRLGKVRPRPARTGTWYRFARAVMRRAGAIAAATALVMLAIAAPVLGMRWSGIDATVLPASQSARVVSDTIARDFPGADSTPLTLAVGAPAGARRSLDAYAESLRDVPGAREVSAPRALRDGTWEIDVAATSPPAQPPAQRLVRALRAHPSPYPVEVGGAAADVHDQRAAVARTVPLALAMLVALTLTILWLMTGSVVLPFKALVMNLLTTAAAAGVLVVVFQHGAFSGPLGFTAPDGIELTTFLVMVAIVFGLSTDYGVFLLTRITEARDRGLPDGEAVAVGLERTGAIVTAAAILLAVAIGAFVTGRLVFLKELGVGAAAAVLLDAFVVRALLVPALMRLLGGANWWSPRPLRRLHARLALSEG